VDVDLDHPETIVPADTQLTLHLAVSARSSRGRSEDNSWLI
jgi:hypothetical protein